MANGTPWWKLLYRQRRRLAPLFLLGGLAAAMELFGDDWPREREVHYVLEGPGRGAREAHIAYTEGDESVTGVHLNYPNGAPSQVVHRPSLRPGRYDVAIALTLPDGQIAQYRRVLEVPSEGTVRFRLGHPDSQ